MHIAMNVYFKVYQYSRTGSSVSWRNFLQSSSLWCELNDLRNQTFQRELIKFFKKTLETTLNSTYLIH